VASNENYSPCEQVSLSYTNGRPLPGIFLANQYNFVSSPSQHDVALVSLMLDRRQSWLAKEAGAVGIRSMLERRYAVGFHSAPSSLLMALRVSLMDERERRSALCFEAAFRGAPISFQNERATLDSLLALLMQPRDEGKSNLADIRRKLGSQLQGDRRKALLLMLSRKLVFQALRGVMHSVVHCVNGSNKSTECEAYLSQLASSFPGGRGCGDEGDGLTATAAAPQDLFKLKLERQRLQWEAGDPTWHQYAGHERVDLWEPRDDVTRLFLEATSAASIPANATRA
jgi:hypothetical protein